jgi:hypothetical protein
MPVPYYDCADNRLLDMLTLGRAECYLSKGIAHAIRSKKGRILRLYSLPKERVHGSVGEAVAAIHTGSQTIQVIRNESGTRIREYRRPQPMTGSNRNNVPLVSLDIVLRGVPDMDPYPTWHW